MAVIAVDRLHKFYGDVRAADGVTFEVNPGEIFGMVGPNGAGKTTTIECLEGLRRADEGRLSILGLDPQRQGYELRERIGVQLQESSLPDRLKVREVMGLFAAGCLALRSASFHRIAPRGGLHPPHQRDQQEGRGGETVDRQDPGQATVYASGCAGDSSVEQDRDQTQPHPQQ